MSIFSKYKDRMPAEKRKDELDEHYKKMDEANLGKKDFAALLIAAFSTFVPVILVIVGVVFGVLWLMFGRS